MIRPLHESDHVVGPDGTLKMTGLQPGERVHVILLRSDSDQAVVDPAKYRREDFHYERPFDPACDPNDWEALRDSD